MALLQERWHQLPRETAHTQVVAIADALWNDDSSRRTRYQRSLEQYEGRKLPGLNTAAYQKPAILQGDGWDSLQWNVVRLLCKTAHAKIAGRQKPKVQFVASNADWATKRRAKKLDRFVEAQFMQPQDGYEDIWEMCLRAFLDAAVFGVGFLKVFGDFEAGQVSIRRRVPWKLLVDPCETEYGQPQNLFEIDSWDKDKLAAIYPEHRTAIMNAKAEDEPSTGRGQRVSQRGRVYEAWRLPLGIDKPGRWIRCIDGAVLEDEEWTRPEFPLVRIDWARELLGFWCTSLVEETESVSDELNYTLARIREAEHLTPKGICIYEEGSVDEEKLRTNEDAINIPYNSGAKAPPQWISPQAFGQESLTWLKLQWEKVFEIGAISQMGATGRKEPGVTSGVAIRTVSDLQTELFSVIDRQYQGAFVALARHIVAVTRELAQEHKDFSAKWKGGDFLRTVKWADADLPEDSYVVQLYSVSEVKNTPADRLQLAQELNATGKLSDDAFIRVIEYLDTPSEFEGQNKQRELIGRYIEEWLDATPEKLASGEFRYRAPLPIGMNHEDAIVQVAQEYLSAQLEEADDMNLEFFLRFIQQCDDHITAKAKKMAEIQAAAMGKPPGGAPGGAAPANTNMAPAGPPPMAA